MEDMFGAQLLRRRSQPGLLPSDTLRRRVQTEHVASVAAAGLSGNKPEANELGLPVSGANHGDGLLPHSRAVAVR